MITVSPGHARASHIQFGTLLRIEIHFWLIRLQTERGIGEELCRVFGGRYGARQAGSRALVVSKILR